MLGAPLVIGKSTGTAVVPFTITSTETADGATSVQTKLTVLTPPGSGSHAVIPRTRFAIDGVCKTVPTLIDMVPPVVIPVAPK